MSVESIRLRPGMYIGGTDAHGLKWCLWEPVGNAIDEFLAGRAKRISIMLASNGGFTVTDDGGGIRPGARRASRSSIHSRTCRRLRSMEPT